MKIDLLKIKSSFPPPKGNKQGFASYLASMERLIKGIVPESIFELDGVSHFIPAETSFNKLNDALPIINISSADETPCTLSISLLCLGRYTHGLGRFLSDKISRSLVPSKQLMLIVTRSLNFQFLVYPCCEYFILERIVEVESARDLRIVQENFPRIAQEIRITILGVQHARKAVLYKELSTEEKGVMLLENFASLVQHPHQGLRRTIFHDVQRFLLKATQEEDPSAVPEYPPPFLEVKTQESDAAIFNEIQGYLMIFNENFFKSRPLSHIKKVISCFYLFRKISIYTTLTKPGERHISFKLQKTKLKVDHSSVPILALLIGVNFVEDNEVLDEEDVFRVIKKELPGVELVQDSLITKERGRERVRLLYLEMRNSDGRPFTSAAVKFLKKRVEERVRGCIYKVPASSTLPNYGEDKISHTILTPKIEGGVKKSV